MTIVKAREYCRGKLRDVGISDYESDSDILINYVTGTSRSVFVMEPDRVFSEYEEKRLMTLLNKRLARMPLQHIMGEAEFYGLTFEVNNKVLIPRPETEILVERAGEFLKKDVRVLDLCTGSGCIIISLASIYRERFGEGGFFAGSDISEDALNTAILNAKKHNTDIHFYIGDMTLPIPKDAGFDIITANPPYIKKADIDGLMPEVKEYDPRLALEGGSDGLLYYRRIAGGVRDILNPGGLVFLEIGYDQAEDVKRIFDGLGFDIEIVKDYSGHDRVVVLKTGKMG